jgi:kynurenine 3-monooxygenase
LRAEPSQTVNIVGAGLSGALLAVMLARRGFTVHLYDRRPDPRIAGLDRGRSINLALAARGIRALERAGVMQRIHPLMIPMRGRMVHDLGGRSSLQPYGQQEHEVIYSIERAALNRVLIEEAARHPSLTLRFDEACRGVDTQRDVLKLASRGSRAEHEAPLTPTFASDGAGSIVRSSLATRALLTTREDWLDHDYKELSIPAISGQPALYPGALHIWPRGGFMLIALPNTDASFTATLFLAREGHNSFARLNSRHAVQQFFQQEFSDATKLIPDLLAEFASHPQGQLGTVHATPWHVQGKVLLVGDAAHAIVPFHGQGMNAAFEDCLVLDALLDRHESWESLFAAFEQARREDTDAIAQMALENYIEMRDTVLDAGFVRRKEIAMQLERRFPGRFIPRYSMVMFHPEISYAEALRRGTIQEMLLEELDDHRTSSGEIDLALAEQWVLERLPPISREAA